MVLRHRYPGPNKLLSNDTSSYRAALKPRSHHYLLAKLVEPQVALSVKPRRPLIRGPSFSSCKKRARRLTFCYLATENAYLTRVTATVCLEVPDHTFPPRPVTVETKFLLLGVSLIRWVSYHSPPLAIGTSPVQPRTPHASCLWLSTTI